MAHRLVLDYEILSFSSSKLTISGLLGIEMVKTWFARNNLAIFSKLQSL